MNLSHGTKFNTSSKCRTCPHFRLQSVGADQAWNEDLVVGTYKTNQQHAFGYAKQSKLIQSLFNSKNQKTKDWLYTYIMLWLTNREHVHQSSILFMTVAFIANLHVFFPNSLYCQNLNFKAIFMNSTTLADIG